MSPRQPRPSQWPWPAASFVMPQSSARFFTIKFAGSTPACKCSQKLSNPSKAPCAWPATCRAGTLARVLLTLLLILLCCESEFGPMNPEQSQPEIKPASSGSSIASASDDLARASDPALTPDLALALLLRRDLPPDAVEQIAHNAGVMKSRKVRIAVAAHPRAAPDPRVLHVRLNAVRSAARRRRRPEARRRRPARHPRRFNHPWRAHLPGSPRFGQRGRRPAARQGNPRLANRPREYAPHRDRHRPRAPAHRRLACFCRSRLPPPQMVAAPRNSHRSAAQRKNSALPRPGIRPPAFARPTARRPARLAPARKDQELSTERIRDEVEVRLNCLSSTHPE